MASNALPEQPSTAREDRAYFAHDVESYVCWDCAEIDEREDPVPDGDAAGDQCARCENYWEYADA